MVAASAKRDEPIFGPGKPDSPEAETVYREWEAAARAAPVGGSPAVEALWKRYCKLADKPAKTPAKQAEAAETGGSSRKAKAPATRRPRAPKELPAVFRARGKPAAAKARRKQAAAAKPAAKAARKPAKQGKAAKPGRSSRKAQPRSSGSGADRKPSPTFETIFRLMQRKNGTSEPEVCEALGWKAAGATISRAVRTAPFKVRKERVDGRTRYFAA
jgi:hypothetical protein